MQLLNKTFFVTFISFVYIHTVKSELIDDLFKLYVPISHNTNISAECLVQSAIYHKALVKKSMWALQMMDASGKFPSGIFSGNLFELGQFDQCIAITHNENHITIDGKYCLTTISVRMKHFSNEKQENLLKFDLKSTIDGITPISSLKADQKQIGLFSRWAICVPDACSASDVQKHLNIIFKVLFKADVNVIVQKLDCQSRNTTPTLQTGDWIMVVLFIIFGLLLIGQTTYEGYLVYNNSEPSNPLLISFSIISNIKKLGKLNKGAQKFNCLDGIRCFSMMWIVYGHQLQNNIVPGTVSNIRDVYLFFNYWYNYFPLGAMVAVDTFFVMSGMLLMYIFLKKNILEKPFNIPMLFIHRYLRLTPPLLFALLFVLTLSKFVGSGPLWPRVIDFERSPCETNWWAPLLYIQNYRQPENICLQHTWYLSADMQMFLISPLIIFITHKLGKYGIYFLISLIIVFMIVPLGIVLSYDIHASYKAVLTNIMDYFHLYYLPTHSRAATYIVGLTLGYIMFKCSTKNIQISFVTNIICWIVSLAVMTAILLCQYPMNQAGYERNVIFEAFYLSAHRVLWSICLSWIIFACSFGYGGPINWLLSRPFFQILAKLTYCIYIVHFSMLFYRVGSQKTTAYFSSLNVYWEFAGDLIFATILATIWTLVFEIPFGVIEDYIFKTSKSRN